MPKLIIQLSDIHLTQNDSKNVSDLDVSKLFEFMNEKLYKELDDVFILFTGDLTYNGYKNEFTLFNNFIEKINSYFVTKLSICPKIITIPGNHDININNREVNFDDLINFEKNGNIDKLNELALNEIKKMRHYFEICGHSFGENRFISVEKYDNLSFVMINSAPFSCKEKKDKEHHFIPKDAFENLNYESLTDSYNFVLIHHRPDWFEYNSQQSLTDLIRKKANICFCGHEHIENAIGDKIYEDIIWLNSGELYIKNKTLYGNVNAVLISDCGKISIRGFSYKRGDASYSSIFKEITSEMFYKQSNSFSANFNKQFFITLGDDKESNLSAIFEMPNLIGTSKYDDINNFEELVDFLINGNRVFIYGRSNSGKTTLIKRIMKELELKQFVLHISHDEISNNFESVIENSFYKVYGYHKNFNDIKQLNPVMFVDGIDLVDTEARRNKFIDFVWVNFDSFLFCSSTKQSELNNNKIQSMSGYVIHGFSLKQRNSYISKICACFDTLSDDEIEKIKSAVEISFASCSLLDLTNPYFILEICIKIITDELYMQQNVSDAFSLIFINDINNRIIDYGKKENLEDYLNVLSEISFRVCHDQKSILFDSCVIDESVKKCKEDYKNIKISYNDFLNTFLQSRIMIKCDNDNYKICHNSVLAYLASRKICTEYKSGNFEILSELYKNVEVGINGDILLFVLYQLKETSVLFKIRDLLNDALSGYEEINLDTRNNPILRMKKDYGPETQRQAENKQEFIDRLDSEEKKQIKEIESNEQQALKENNQNDIFIKTIQRALKLIEILTKAVSGFKTELKHNKRTELAECAVSSLLRVFYAVFDVSEKDAEELHDIFEKFKEEKIRIAKHEGKNEKAIESFVSEFSFENFVYDIMTTNLLNDMSYLAKVMISNVSIEVIKQLNSTNNWFCYKLFQLIAFQQSGALQTNFIRCLEEIMKENKFIGNTEIVRRVVRVFSITNSIKSNDLDRLSAISGIKKKQLLLYNTKKTDAKLK